MNLEGLGLNVIGSNQPPPGVERKIQRQAVMVKTTRTRTCALVQGVRPGRTIEMPPERPRVSHHQVKGRRTATTGMPSVIQRAKDHGAMGFSGVELGSTSSSNAAMNAMLG